MSDFEYNFNVMLDRIKLLKKELKITNAKLAELSGVPVGTLNKILGSETKEPSVNAIIKIAKALGVSANYIIYGKEGRTSFSLEPIEIKHIENYRTLDERGKEVVDLVLNSQFERCKLSNAKNQTNAAKPTAPEQSETPEVYEAARDGKGFSKVEDEELARKIANVVLSGKKSKKPLP